MTMAQEPVSRTYLVVTILLLTSLCDCGECGFPDGGAEPKTLLDSLTGRVSLGWLDRDESRWS